jgi:hypothetical protein
MDKQTNGRTNKQMDGRTNIFSIFRDKLSLPHGSSDSFMKNGFVEMIIIIRKKALIHIIKLIFGKFFLEQSPPVMLYRFPQRSIRVQFYLHRFCELPMGISFHHHRQYV